MSNPPHPPRAISSVMGKFTFPSFVLDQWTRLPPPLSADLQGKTILVTGANTGVGLEVAKHFAKMKPSRLIIACRSEARGRDALESENSVVSQSGSHQVRLLSIRHRERDRLRR